MKKLFILMTLLASVAFAQNTTPATPTTTPSTSSGLLFGTLTDAPQHVVAIGAGIGPTTQDFALVAGFGEKIANATYSYTGVSLIPKFNTTSTGARSVGFTTVPTSGIKQLVYQQGIFTVALDGSVGTSLPTASAPSFNFAGIGAVDLIWRLNSKLNTVPGSTNQYIFVQPSFTQTTGSNASTTIAVAVGFAHGIN